MRCRSANVHKCINYNWISNAHIWINNFDATQGCIPCIRNVVTNGVGSYGGVDSNRIVSRTSGPFGDNGLGDFHIGCQLELSSGIQASHLSVIVEGI